MLDLRNMTLITIDGVDPILAAKALIYSSREINFGKIKLLSFEKPKNLPSKIEFIKIERLSYKQWEIFEVHNLNDYVDTEYCITIHTDGFILNPSNWLPDFLQYDYIGAPWPPNLDEQIPFDLRVGNDALSLRSKRFLEVSAYKVPKEQMGADIKMCRKYKSIYLNEGIKYAPIELAMKFSLEYPIPECEYNLTKTFGFHNWNIVGNNHLKELLNFNL